MAQGRYKPQEYTEDKVPDTFGKGIDVHKALAMGFSLDEAWSQYLQSEEKAKKDISHNTNK